MNSTTPVTQFITIGNTQDSVIKVCRQILSEVKSRKFSKDDIFAIHLAIEEAFINALKHGNKMDPQKEIKIKYSADGKKFEISVTDQGQGFDPESIPDPRTGDNIYKTDGRGLLLIRSYMDLVEYNKSGNSIHMIKYNTSNS